MLSPTASATLKAAFLTLCSALIATFLTDKNPPIVALVIFAILSTPPNFKWQQYLEHWLPGYDTEKNESSGEVKGGTVAGGGVTIKRRLNVTNTVLKVVIDQTLGAVVNVALYLGAVEALQGVPLRDCLQVVKETGSPRNPKPTAFTSNQFSSPFATPTGTPLATTSYSPFASAKLKAPSPYGGPMQFTPRQRHKYRRYGRAGWFKLKRILSSRATWLLLVVVLAITWWLNGGSEELSAVKLGAAGFGKDLFQDGATQDLQFFPPSNPKIHYVGRWTSTPNQLRKDGTFSGRAQSSLEFEEVQAKLRITGVYFDIKIRNTTSLLLSLRNTPDEPTSSASKPSVKPSALESSSDHISFRPNSASNKPAPPISLLARVDQEEYVLLANASALVAICSGSLQRDAEHNIRITALMTDDRGKGVVQLEGIWLSKGGQFEPVGGTILHDYSDDEDLLTAQSDEVGEKHRTGLSKLLNGNRYGRTGEAQGVLKENVEFQDYRDRRKLLEVLTDTPGSSGRRQRGTRTGGVHGLLAGVMGWEYLLGEMFSVDHVAIGVDGMCLTQNCIGGAGHPAGLGDMFFRSGPPAFRAKVDILQVLDLGNSDKASFDLHASEYNQSAWDLAESFENSYISLIKAIRTLAYPKHPATIQSERLGYKIYVPNTVPASIPIFIMRPLRGELEHSTQNIVNHLRADGDKAVFWLDTSGWLDSNVPSDEKPNRDFYLDDQVEPSKWRLTERGNQRVAIFLHMHVCRYLAREGEKCPFLPAEVYQGKVFDPSERDFERYVEGEKEKKLKRLFWDEGEDGNSGSVKVPATTVMS
ncbi:MAG: hypothetical protein LQ343_007685 [Gyalolechia ehrenbergii]|nr:MAG: hypothetical protein LQ343_007685 [Gyalolechia ehrenbergii]